MFNSDAIAGNAGATIVEDNGLINTNELMANIAFHFLIEVQFFGFSGSPSPSQVTFHHKQLPSRVFSKEKDIDSQESFQTEWNRFQALSPLSGHHVASPLVPLFA